MEVEENIRGREQEMKEVKERKRRNPERVDTEAFSNHHFQFNDHHL